MLWPATLILLLTAADPALDPRVDLVERQLTRDYARALEMVDSALEQRPEAAGDLGLNYLRGHLLLLLDREPEALQAFADTMAASPELAPYGRFRLAVAQAESGHPEVAAGLLATLIGQQPPRQLLAPAVQLLERTLADGGDCRLLAQLHRVRVRSRERRFLDLARATCAARGGDPESAQERLLSLLREDARDDIALRAARTLAPASDSATLPPPASIAVGTAFYEHREFAVAARHLRAAIARAERQGDMSARQLFDARYALARSYFWLGRYQTAARAYAALAADTSSAGRKAQVLYQRARSLELDLEGEASWPRASAAFQAAHAAEPRGRWAAAALIGRLRLAWLRGDEEAAGQALDELLRRRKLSHAARSLLFFATSDLVSGRGERAGAWLQAADRLNRLPDLELDYWRGRLAEIEGRTQDAVERYLEVLRQDSYHPFAHGARQRLDGELLAETARRTGARLAASERAEALLGAWLLLGDQEPMGADAARRLDERLAVDSRHVAFLELDITPPKSWPLWRSRLAHPEEMLLALGLFDEAPSRVLRHFPVTEPQLAFTGSTLLSRAGATKRSLYIAEILNKRLPGSLPVQRLPEDYRKLLYPFRYSFLILRESRKRDVDPYLLAGLIREESRFDPDAFSGASARGLTQFVFPTAREIARGEAGIGPLEPADLHRPEIAVALGAAYLQRLDERMGGATERVIAAYNAGEPQAELWRRYCLSDEPEEYLSKVAFRETRSYLRKVLTSRAHYEDLYRPESRAPER
ncbi:MAG: transglycosylase SLT domain-containing protein [Acidobacteriota bacterium]